MRSHILHRCLVFVFSSLMMTTLSSQQAPQYTQFMLNRYQFNPAYAGLDRSLSITAGLRTQWTQFEGSPSTQFVNVHLPLYALDGSVGFGLESDQLGPLNRVVISGSYNYVFESIVGLLSFGGRVGVNQVEIDASVLRTPMGTVIDNVVDLNDPILLTTDLSGVSPWWGVGLYLVNDYGELGLSLDNIPSNGSTAGSSQFNASQQLTFYAKTDVPINDLFTLAPNVLIRSDFVQTQVDVGALVHYESIFGGLTIRGFTANSRDALNFIGGAQLNENIRLSYSFDFNISGLRTFHDGTHEFVVNYNLNKKIRTGEYPPIIYNPRYN